MTFTVTAATTLPDGEPRRTLGWEVIRWCESLMLSPMADGSPLRFTVEQCRFLAWWYAVDADGRWLYRRGVLRRAKGWGKDPLGAIVALVEMLGPSRVAGWDADGEPLGAPAARPLVAVAATSEAQTRNTTGMLDVLPTAKMRKLHRYRFGERVCRGVTTADAAAELRPVTSSWRSSEGARVTAVIAGETQHWRATNPARTASPNETTRPGSSSNANPGPATSSSTPARPSSTTTSTSATPTR